MKLTVKLETITPDIATRWLEKNIDNRTLRNSSVDNLSSEMRAGRFGISTDCIGFDEDGNMINGQHRLWGVIESGCSILALVGRGFPKMVNDRADLFTADILDGGIKRSVSDQLQRMHGIANANLTAAAARSIGMICINGSPGAFPMGKTQVILSIYGEEIHKMINAVGHFKPVRKASVVGALAFAAKSFNGQVSAFVEKLAYGECLKKGDPAFALRQHLINNNQPASGNRNIITAEWVGNALHSALTDSKLVQVKRGAAGIDFLRSKQKANVEKVCALLGL